MDLQFNKGSERIRIWVFTRQGYRWLIYICKRTIRIPGTFRFEHSHTNMAQQYILTLVRCDGKTHGDWRFLFVIKCYKQENFINCIFSWSNIYFFSSETIPSIIFYLLNLKKNFFILFFIEYYIQHYNLYFFEKCEWVFNLMSSVSCTLEISCRLYWKLT